MTNTTSTEEAMRAAFEEECVKRGLTEWHLLRDFQTGEYGHPMTSGAWLGWQAREADVLQLREVRDEAITMARDATTENGVLTEQLAQCRAQTLREAAAICHERLKINEAWGDDH